MRNSSHLIRQKIARLAAGDCPRVLDLFAGCGGLSLGFHAAGFKLAAAVEIDPDAAASHGRNFHGGDAQHSKARDITALTPEDLAADLDLGKVGTAIDILVGGPPCQAFARVGRSKLREIDAHPQAFKHDPRARLYLEYLRYVTAFQPLAILMENVPDVLNHDGQNIAEEICEKPGKPHCGGEPTVRPLDAPRRTPHQSHTRGSSPYIRHELQRTCSGYTRFFQLSHLRLPIVLSSFVDARRICVVVAPLV